MPRKTRSGGGRRGRGSRRAARRGFSAGRDASARAMATLTACRSQLAAECADLQRKMNALENALQSLRSGGAPARRPTAGRRVPRGPRRVRSGSLKDYITRVLGSANGAMRLTDISRAVVKAGYPTRSRNLPNQVSMAMAAMAKKRLIRRVGRGLYRV